MTTPEARIPNQRLIDLGIVQMESLRKKKLEHWQQNSESNRSWLALNMNTEAAAGFPAFHYGQGAEREIDFALLRRLYAEGARIGAPDAQVSMPPPVQTVGVGVTVGVPPPQPPLPRAQLIALAMRCP